MDKIQPSIVIPSIGTLYQKSNGENAYWFGRLNNISPDNEVELKINVTGYSTPTSDQIKFIERLPLEYSFFTTLLLTHLKVAFERTPQEASLKRLREIYFLSGIELKANSYEWWFVLEPIGDVPTPYNFFPRFTVIDKEIVWTNVS